MIIGLELEQALKQLEGQNIEIIYNNSDKLTDFDSQLVVACRHQQNKIILVVCNMKLKV